MDPCEGLAQKRYLQKEKYLKILFLEISLQETPRARAAEDALEAGERTALRGGERARLVAYDPKRPSSSQKGSPF